MQELCRPGKRPRLATVERWAKQRRIRVQYDGQGGVWTTTTALNEALGLERSDEPTKLYSISELL
nr:hypothetical protein [Stenotrophomonas maltophilia]